MTVTLDRMQTGQTARVVALHGGRGMRSRLESMGLRPGKTVKKLSSQLMAGPVTVLVEGHQLAMGRGIAAKVEVDVLPG